jgi:vesicle coat complex subunit
MVRGLALRSLTSLRLESIIEYAEQPLEKALTDLSAYVRKTGVMGVLKVYSLRRSVIERGTYIEQLVTQKKMYILTIYFELYTETTDYTVP